MKQSAFLLLFTVSAALPVFAGAQATSTSTSDVVPTITVTGEGKRTMPPDRASVFLSVQNRGRTPSLAGQENARMSTAIRAAVAALGIDRALVTTLNYNVRPSVEIIHGPQGREERRDSAFVATNTVRVEIRNLDLISRVIDTSLTAGATNVMSVSYSLADLTRARREATAEAVRLARENAEAIATAAGGSLGDLIELRTDPVRIYGPQPLMATERAMMRIADAVAEPTPVSPRDIDITAYVTARWKFVKGPR